MGPLTRNRTSSRRNHHWLEGIRPDVKVAPIGMDLSLGLLGVDGVAETINTNTNNSNTNNTNKHNNTNNKDNKNNNDNNNHNNNITPTTIPMLVGQSFQG